MAKNLLIIFVFVISLCNRTLAHSNQRMLLGSFAEELKVKDCANVLHLKVNKRMASDDASVGSESDGAVLVLPLFENEEKEDDELFACDNHLTVGELQSAMYLYSSCINYQVVNNNQFSSYPFFYTSSLRYVVFSSFRI